MKTKFLRGTSMMKTLELPSRAAWRDWLARNYDSVREIWLVFDNRHSRPSEITYDDAVEEALCYGWVDSLIKHLDDCHYARKFTPRKPDSRWSTANRRRYEKLAAAGLLATPGVNRPPTSRSGDAPRLDPFRVPTYIQEAIAANAAASRFFERLAPSQRRLYIGWIDGAKKEETRRRRLKEALESMSAGKALGLK
jgi:uncharacterized protein YdeI (YjbR/CyaY-like superfamily)